jgi:hypothetical protein
MKTSALVLLGVALAFGAGCKKPKPDAPVAAASASVAESPVWTPEPDVVAIAKIFRGESGPGRPDPTGDTLELASFPDAIPGWSAEFARVKGTPAAKKVSVEGTGPRCKRERFSQRSMPLGGNTYRGLRGGPLDGLILKEYQYPDGSCLLHFASREYADAQEWNVPNYEF